MAKSNGKKKRKRNRPVEPVGARPAPAPPTLKSEPLVKVELVHWLKSNAIVLVPLVAVFFYAYWPTWVWVESAWRNEPDYSHGYLVPFLAGLLCWHRRDSFPGIRVNPSWVGLSLIVLAIAMRIAGRMIFADFLDAWSMVPFVAGVVWVVFGPATLKWALPAIAFLLFMFPLPYQAETMMSWKLQGIATDLSTVFLRVLGQPAVSEGHVIWFNDERLMVEEACSGLRIFIGVAALAFFWSAMVKRSWLDRVVLLASVLPLAVFVNAVRITTVGILYQFYDDPQTQQQIHDVSGYLMIPFAFGLLWLLKVFWEHLYRPVEILTAKDFVPRTA